jgi:hypothetical protein
LHIISCIYNFLIRIWTFKVKDLKFPTCKKQGSFFWKRLQINKLHEFELKHKLGLINKRRKKFKLDQMRKKKKTRAKGKLEVWMGV